MKKGFTLVELLIVLAVIAALMAVATPMAMNAVKQAKASQVAQNLNALKSAVEQYVYSEKELPKSEASLTNYMSKIPDGYTVTPDAAFVKGEATVTVAYTVGDILPVDVNKQYSEATKVTLPSSSLEHPGVYVKVRQWW
mgnify:FL=1